MDDLAAHDDTCELWYKFVLEDCLPYIGLYIAMRSGNWNLRMYSIKEMAATTNVCFWHTIELHIKG